MSVSEPEEEFVGARCSSDDSNVQPSPITFEPVEPVSTILVDTNTALTAAIDEMTQLPEDNAILCVDLEGVDLKRSGTIEIIQVYVVATGKVFLVDVTTLKRQTFTITATDSSVTLKDVFEDVRYTKLLFDLRNDADALWGLYQVLLRGVEDVQLMCYAYWRNHDDDCRDFDPDGTRRNRRHESHDRVQGLPKCIVQDAQLDPETTSKWWATKQYGQATFKTAADFKKWAVRPLDERLQEYCSNDVRFLKRLRDIYWPKLDSVKRKRVIFETESRVADAQAPEYVEHRAEGPHGLGTWYAYGDEAYPVIKPSVNGVPQKPECYCGRYQGMRHICNEQCKCYEVHCKWWVDRAPPKDGKPAGPKYDPKLGYKIPQKNALDQVFSQSDFKGIRGVKDMDAARYHLDMAVAQLRERNRGSMARGDAPPVVEKRVYSEILECRDRARCLPELKRHTGLCFERNGMSIGRDGKNPAEYWKLRETYTIAPPKKKAWGDAEKLANVKSGLKKGR